MTFVVNFAVALRLWVLVGLLVCQSARAISAETVQNEVFEQELQPIIAKYCLRCHGSELQEGDLRIDRLNPDLLDGKDADFWHEWHLETDEHRHLLKQHVKTLVHKLPNCFSKALK